MLFSITSAGIRSMADRVAADLGRPKAYALELLSHALGFRNWDTCSGVLRQEALPRLKEKKTFWSAVAATESDCDSPAWARFEITPDTWAHIQELAAMCRTGGLSLVAVPAGATVVGWEELDADGDYRNIQNWQIYATADCVWFRGKRKHYAHAVETPAIGLDRLGKLLSQDCAGEVDATRVWGGEIFHDPQYGAASLLTELAGAWKLPVALASEDRQQLVELRKASEKQ